MVSHISFSFKTAGTSPHVAAVMILNDIYMQKRRITNHHVQMVIGYKNI